MTSLMRPALRSAVVLALGLALPAAVASPAFAADSIYWENYDFAGPQSSISVANLDGSGSGRDLFTNAQPRGTAVVSPAGLTLDAAAGSIYWANATSTEISRGSLDGCDP